jgi:hypothetical protein
MIWFKIEKWGEMKLLCVLDKLWFKVKSQKAFEKLKNWKFEFLRSYKIDLNHLVLHWIFYPDQIG